RRSPVGAIDGAAGVRNISGERDAVFPEGRGCAADVRGRRGRQGVCRRAAPERCEPARAARRVKENRGYGGNGMNKRSNEETEATTTSVQVVRCAGRSHALPASLLLFLRYSAYIPLPPSAPFTSTRTPSPSCYRRLHRRCARCRRR